ncbi:multisubunit sodium/proton antiporter, MrpA subunit [Mariniphaga anaerophila]|uniref:Multisubunit sodium/proton antiporter, MrpA subunit n=1 Tax=Mariniphaga anaerophila TaxID=1484053 RepID=A0A1M5CZL0_9BACT|nr:hydrogen gas-evolving membrane-bound hydrogenase subunit E [Mariniphaga anaerophila]SHF60120.1 multisubunit sodium/proton antiporter, MrpA subunit [Mariniphaga anaerophila]
MVYILLVFLSASLLIFILPGWLKKQKAILLSFVQFAAFIYFLSHVSEITSYHSKSIFIEWIPQLGLNLEFMLDGLSMVFALLVTGIGALVFLYAKDYMKSYAGTDKFFFYLMLFSGAMLGLVLSGNLIQLFIFWELTSFISFFLISFFHEKESARKAAFQSLYITGFGGLSMLAGIVLLGSVVDSYSFSDWLSNANAIKESNLYLPGLLLILAGIFTKSAQFPFHFWLPGAMQAPAPVSSYLHSATMVKAGIFLLARLSPVLGGTPEWTYIISLTGVLTMLTGSYFAITQTDLKGILAFTTINALGVLVLLLGINTTESIKAAMLFLFIHAFYKATLFMVAGLIEKKTGTRELRQLGGLIKYMPLTFVIAFLALLSMAGLPPLLGFLGKELIYEAKVQSPGIASMILILGVTSNIFMVAVSLYFARKVFLGKPGNFPKQPNERGAAFLIGPGVLALLSLVLGLSPGKLGSAVIKPALSAVLGEVAEVKLKIWHGFNQVFFLSMLTIILGFLLYVAMLKKDKLLIYWKKINDVVFAVQLDEVFAWVMDKFVAVSKLKTKTVQHGYHRLYILTIIVFTSLLLWFQVFVTRSWNFDIPFTLRPFYISGLALVIILASAVSAVSRSRIVTIISMGVAGYGISLIFLYYSAVDLAITQILVETLTLVMFMAILQKLPRFAVLSSKKTRLRDFLIALGFGSVMTILALKAVNVNLNRSISDFYLENSYLKAFGENVVNVILVDFRALDTLGEVTVLTIAAVGVYLLLSKPKSRKL